MFEDRIPHAQPEPVLQQPVLSAGVDDDLGAHVSRTRRAVWMVTPTARSPSNSTSRTRVPSCTVDAVLARVVEHHLVELAAHDLPGLRALVRLVVPEVERRRQLAGGVDELDAVLLDEVALLHLRQHVEPLQHPVGFGNQRFADVKAGKVLALEDRDAQTLLGQERRGGRAGRAAADDDHVDVRMLERPVVIASASQRCVRVRLFVGVIRAADQRAGFDVHEARAPARRA